MQGSYTSGAWKTFASCRCCPGPSGLEDRHARCYINDAGLVAEFGIAPNSPRLQRGANLSQLFSRKRVPPRGNAPRSIDYRSIALLLSYGGEKSPVKVMHPRLPGVGRACCYYTNGRKMVTASGLSPDRTELRTRLLEILCICGGGGAPENRTLDAVMAQLFSGQFPRLCRTCSVKNGSQSWTRTNTPCGT